MATEVKPGAVVLGLGGTVDYEITWNPAVLERMAAAAAIRADELTAPGVITSERDLIRSVLSFIAAGAGGERYITNPEIIEWFAAHFNTRVTIGGTCVRAALAMDKLRVPSTIHLVSINDHVRRLLPDSVGYLSSAAVDSTDPHLIVQYPEGAHIRAGDLDIRAAHANRLIYVHDPASRDMRLSDDLPAALGSADCFLISGLNSMQDPADLDARLDQLAVHMRALPPTAFVMYEDAGYHVPELSDQVRTRVAPMVDVYSMNEDEMHGHLGRSVDLLNADSVATALADLQQLILAPTLLVHTARWALAVGEGAAEYGEALRAGAATAGARFVHGDTFTEADYHTVRSGPVHSGGDAMAHRLAEMLSGQVCCVPGYDPRPATPTTIGLGDTFVGGFLAVVAGVQAAATGHGPAYETRADKPATYTTRRPASEEVAR